MDENGKNEHILNLASEIISDIEGNKLSAESLVLKSTRLAKLAGSTKIQSWLWYERTGYNKTEPISIEYLSLTGRIINKSSNFILYGSLATQEASIESTKLQIEILKSNPETPQINSLKYGSFQPPSKAQTLSGLIVNYQRVVSTVKGLIHNFALTIYYEKIFSDINKNIFSQYQIEVDKLLSGKCDSVLEKIPTIYKRLSERDIEAISHALTSCRRIIDTFADVIYPPTNSTIQIGGNELKLSPQHHQNRINAFINEKTQSDSRRKKLRQTLGNLYSRVSAGVHSDVTLDEAKSLFLETYLFLGEILKL